MAVKSQIDIDVGANEFLAFKAKFDEYAAALAKAPAAWRGIGARTLPDHVESRDRKGIAQIQRVGACPYRKSRATFSGHAL